MLEYIMFTKYSNHVSYNSVNCSLFIFIYANQFSVVVVLRKKVVYLKNCFHGYVEFVSDHKLKLPAIILESFYTQSLHDLRLKLDSQLVIQINILAEAETLNCQFFS